MKLLLCIDMLNKGVCAEHISGRILDVVNNFESKTEKKTGRINQMSICEWRGW